MITKTGKVGKYYDTHYWFKQAYLRWDYKSIPNYDEYFYLGYLPRIQNYTVTTAINKTVCNHLSVSIYQYYTQESYRQNILYVRLTFNTDVKEYIKEFITPYYTEEINQYKTNHQTFEFQETEENKLQPANKVSIVHKLPNQASFENCPFQYRPDDYGRLIYNLHDSFDTPTRISMNTAIENYYSLNSYQSFKALGTVADNVLVKFISIGVRTNDEGEELTGESLLGTDHFALNNSFTFTHAYNAPAVTVGLRSEDYTNQYLTIDMNYNLATASFVKVLQLNG